MPRPEVNCLHYTFFHLATDAGRSAGSNAGSVDGAQVFLDQAEKIKEWVALVTRQPRDHIDKIWARSEKLLRDITDAKGRGGFHSVVMLSNWPFATGEPYLCDVAAQRWHDAASWLLILKSVVPEGVVPEILLRDFCAKRWTVDGRLVLGQSIVGRIRGVAQSREVALTYLQPCVASQVEPSPRSNRHTTSAQADALSTSPQGLKRKLSLNDVSETSVLEGHASLYTLSVTGQPWWESTQTWLTLQIVEDSKAAEQALDDLTVHVLWYLELTYHKIHHEVDGYQATQMTMLDQVRRARVRIRVVAPELFDQAELPAAQPPRHLPDTLQHGPVVRHDLSKETAEQLGEELDETTRTYTHLSLAIADVQFTQSTVEANVHNLTERLDRLARRRMADNRIYEERADLAALATQQIHSDLSRAEPMQRALETVLGVFSSYLEVKRQSDERRAENNRRRLERRITLAVAILTLAQVYGVAVTVVTASESAWPKSMGVWLRFLDISHIPPQWIALAPVVLLLVAAGYLLTRALWTRRDSATSG